MLHQTVWLIFTFCIFLIRDVKSQTCQFSINTDMQKKAPMMISATDGQTILVPNTKNGEVSMRNGQTVHLACPGTTNSVDRYGSQMVLATCSSGKMFVINGQARSIADIECRRYPTPYADVNGQCAGNQGEIIEVGFQFNNFKNTRLIVCFNPQKLTTFWTKTLVSRLSPFICSTDAIAFDKKYFGNVNPDDRYKQQHSRLPAQYVISSNQLQKGHLVAKCDFLDAASKRMTYYYFNTAPQWKSFNGGNWRNLETVVRKEAAQRNPGVIVYTGTHGLLDLGNTKITLDSSGKMPVPLYFWKVVIDQSSGKGVAFVGVNDPFNLYPSICPDVCGQVDWLGNFDNLRKNKNHGIVYCCTVDNLRIVPGIVLPNFPEYRNGLLD